MNCILCWRIRDTTTFVAAIGEEASVVFGLANLEMMLRYCSRIVVAYFAFTVSVVAGNSSAPSASTTPIAPRYEAVLSGLEFRALGPALQGGRIDELAVVEQSPDTFYVGAATGGLWKTTNGGTTFEPVFDSLPGLTVGAVAVAPSNPSIVWVGSGEPNNRQSSSWGTGVYKSLDAGHTWEHVGLDDTQAIGRVVIDPIDANVVYVAALGHLWGSNSERGLFKTTDGGKTWSKVLFIDNDTGVVDVAVDPGSPNILYAAAYERRRTAWGFDGGGPGSALYKSVDRGLTWKKLTAGLPGTGNLGRIGIAVYRKNPEIVYCVIEGKEGGVFRSDDRGETWKKMSGEGLGSAYFSQIRIDPNNDLRVWGLLDFLMKSEDGGKNFTPDMRTDAHWDFHDLWIDLHDSRHILAATDGGIYRSRDGAKTWEYLDILPLGQIYRAAYDSATPYHICGGFQDNGVLCSTSRNRSAEGIANTDWQRILTADGFDVVLDSSDPDIIYSESQDGGLTRLDLKSHEWFPIAPEAKAGEPLYRFGWEAPLIESSHDPKVLYFGANFLFRSTDRGNSWTRLGDDLTTAADRNKLLILGKSPSADTVSLNYGVAAYPSISTIAESPLDPNILWVGTEDGNVQLSRDRGQTWKNVASAIPDLPQGLWGSSIVASNAAPNVAYVAFDGHRSDDFKTYIFRTNDFGRSWTSVANGIPNGGTVQVLREDPANPNLLFAGTEYGAYITFDRGASWHKFGSGLPNVPVDDIRIQPREHDLILATHGRSFYVLDDIRPLEELNQTVLDSDLHLFHMRPAISWRLFISSNAYNGDHYFTAPNPPYGALISYYLKQDAEKVTLTVRDHAGKPVQQIEGSGHAGLHRVNWDLRYTTANKPLDLQVWGAEQGFLIYHSLPHLGMPGPIVPPGEYSVEVKAGSAVASGSVSVQDDPNVTLSPGDRQAHDELTMQAFELYERGMSAQSKVTALDRALSEASEVWKKNGVKIPASVQSPADALSHEVEELLTEIKGPKKRDPLHQTSTPLIRQLAELLYSFEAHAAAPTPTQKEKLASLEDELTRFSARLEKAAGSDLDALNAAMREAQLPYITVPAKTVESEEKSGEDDN
jgi:photosystem II stability/assembly factor-like uncharacterized protein